MLLEVSSQGHLVFDGAGEVTVAHPGWKGRGDGGPEAQSRVASWS